MYKRIQMEFVPTTSQQEKELIRELQATGIVVVTELSLQERKGISNN